MDIPDFSMVSKNVKEIMGSAKSLGQQATAKADSAVSIFSTSAKDKIQAVDGFGKSVADVLTESKTTVLGKLNTAKDWLTNTKIGSLGSLNDMLASASALKKDAMALQAEINSVVSDSVGTIRGMSNEVMGVAQDALYEINKIPFDKIRDGDYWLNIATGGSIDEINNLSYLASSFLSRAEDIKSDFTNQYAKVSLALGVGVHASQLGLSNIVGAVLDEYGNEESVRNALIATFPDAVTQGNLALVKVMIEKFGKDTILIKYPTAVAMIITGYQLPIGAKSTDYTMLGEQLNEVLTMLAPEWWKCKNIDNAEHNLSVFSAASQAAEKVLSTVEGLRYLIVVSRNYMNSSAISVASQMYPDIAFLKS